MKLFSHAENLYGADTVNRDVLYKIKHNESGSSMLKARTAPLGNKDDLKNLLTKDRTTCPSTGQGVLESIDFLINGTFTKCT